jgi:hypothetical protein
MMIYSSVLLSPELLQKAAMAPIKAQERMLDSITCTTLPPKTHKWYNDIVSSINRVRNLLKLLT